MYVTCCQLDVAWEDKPTNFNRVQRFLERSRPPAGSLVLLPEMFATGFSMDVPAVADDGRTLDFLGQAARANDVNLLAGLATRSADGRGQNVAVLVDRSGRAVGRYQKMHPFTYGGEADCYEAGENVALWEVGPLRVCPFICYDLRFPEVFREGVRMGATLYAVIANWPAAREHHWVSLLVARAIENQAYVAAVNRCGADPKVRYSGRSLIIDPRGQIIADAGGGEGTIGAFLDLPALEDYRKRFPALADMRRPCVR